MNDTSLLTERVLDVSHMDPPEPFENAVEALRTLQEGECLRLLHSREPFPLYSFLNNAGFAYRTVRGTITPFEIYIWRTRNIVTTIQTDAQPASCASCISYDSQSPPSVTS
ncbi:hypothetical protein CCP3SC1_800013 [Gammaproteobacteria bacterium]